MREHRNSNVEAVPELIADYGCHTGENPLWHPMEKRLYWCDIPNGKIFRYDPATDTHEMCFEGAPVGGFTIESDGALLLFMAKGAIARWQDGKLTTIVESIPEEIDSRFNDVIADPAGRVFCGTMSAPSHKGRLYRLDLDGKLTVMLEGIGCSNGMAFSPDRRKMYYTDSYAYEIYIFDYDKATGALTNKQLFVKVSEQDGFPDGATLDAEGFLWSAIWNGSCLIRYSPNAQEERRILIPAKKASSLTFGGEAYSDMYVTTASEDCRTEDDQQAGALFRLRTGIRGVEEFFSRIGS
jgi:D-xylonolactonase